MARPFVLAFAIAILNINDGRAWIPTAPAGTSWKKRTVALRMSNDKERMKTIRALQDAFYSSPRASVDSSDLETVSPPIIHSDGTINDLPLWRVSWTELPGRSNVLIVHEATYTNMFEQIIRQSEQQREEGQTQPMYFGHLRLPGGSSSIGKEGYELNGWQQEAEIIQSSGEDAADTEYCYTDDAAEHASCRSAVVGTLMRIIDYRRMGDGKMLLFVQALERFAVTNPRQELPYSVADVQLLPDSEEVEYLIDENDENFPGDKSGWYAVLDQQSAAQLRSRAVAEALMWQKYELDDTLTLPVRNDRDDDLSPSDVVGTAFKGLIPHVPFSSTIVPSELSSCETLPQSNIDDAGKSNALLENKLVSSGILLGPSEPDPRRRRSYYSAEEIERELWIFVNEWVNIQNAVATFPKELLALLPSNIDWPDDFILEDLAAAAAATSELEGSRPFVRVPEDYPAHRRRRRLSYAISSLTDHTPFGRGMPPILLEMHSTRDRLEAVLDVYEFLNTESLGEFN